MTGIFISYRRVDSAAIAGRLYDRLVAKFGRKRIFMDIEGGIPQGADFPTEIERALKASSAMIVVIGRQWTTCVDSGGSIRIHNEDDWVVNEIANALDRKIFILPVLVDGASMPAEESLPKRISNLCRKQACEVRASSWDYDFERIALAVKPVVAVRPWHKHIGITIAGAAAMAFGIVTTYTYIPQIQEYFDKSSLRLDPINDDSTNLTSSPPPGSYILDFSDLRNVNSVSFKDSKRDGFRITPIHGDWMVSKGYGRPAPYIYFVRDKDEKEPKSGSVSVTASGRRFLLESVDVYSSVERTPYVITGFIGQRSVFKEADVVPNTFGNFARVDNPHRLTPVDKIEITIETYTENPVSNPVGIDNIAVQIPGTEVTDEGQRIKPEAK